VLRGWLGVCSAASVLFAGCGSGDAVVTGAEATSGQAEGDAAPAAVELEIPAAVWTAATVAEDPFVEFELDEGRVRCSPFAFRLEANWLEVTTTDCNYATLVYRFSREVLAGEVIIGEIAWATLASLEPAVGTLAFATARGGVLWTHQVSIPGLADIVTVEFALTESAPAGSALYFHVRNHGYNTWQLSPLTLGNPPG
jgi:hypothetical protein